MGLLSYALTTVDRQKTFQGLSGATYDTILERLINSATDYIEKYCARRFKQTAYTAEVYDGNGFTQLSLKQFPISSTAGFTLYQRDSFANEDKWESIDSEDFFIQYNEGVIEKPTGFIKWPRYYKIDYTAGYNYDNAATFLSDVGMADLEWACWQLVRNAFTQKAQSGNIVSESIGNYSVTFGDILKRNKDIEDTLQMYQRIQLF